MANKFPFQGFKEPKENFYRLPNTWFEQVIPLLREANGNRLAGPLKMLEYILRCTWGSQEWNGSIRLSAHEIKDGRMGINGRRRETGTNLSENTVKKAGEILEKLGLIIITRDDSDLARRSISYAPHISSESEDETATEFHGFLPPTTNYFVVPKIWTDRTRDISSAATILCVEYSFRHCWGFNNENGTWLTIDEFIHGRKHKTTDSRYDNGIGFDEATIYRALDEAIQRGLMVWAEKFEEGYSRKLYNLRLTSMQVEPVTGRCLSPIPWDDDPLRTIEDGIRVVDANPSCTNKDAIRIIEDGSCTDEVLFRTVEDRSLKDTSSDTLNKYSPSCFL